VQEARCKRCKCNPINQSKPFPPKPLLWPLLAVVASSILFPPLLLQHPLPLAPRSSLSLFLATTL
jgi:hypothetical protein